MLKRAKERESRSNVYDISTGEEVNRNLGVLTISTSVDSLLRHPWAMNILAAGAAAVALTMAAVGCNNMESHNSGQEPDNQSTTSSHSSVVHRCENRLEGAYITYDPRDEGYSTNGRDLTVHVLCDVDGQPKSYSVVINNE